MKSRKATISSHSVTDMSWLVANYSDALAIATGGLVTMLDGGELKFLRFGILLRVFGRKMSPSEAVIHLTDQA